MFARMTMFEQSFKNSDDALEADRAIVAALTGDDLIAFVNGKLFPYLHTVPDCPGSTFQGAGVETNPLNDDDRNDFIDKQKTLSGGL